MSRPTGWWPVCDADPVPGNPDVLAALGGHMRDAAAEIERIATLLPQVCTSEVWDSDAGAEFRVKAGTTAEGVAKTHRRFFTVGAALGSSTYGGSGYAAELQDHQTAADAALTAVTGGPGGVGSEDERRTYWSLLLDAPNGADPTQPPAKKGTTGPSAGPMPQASPGVIPPQLPVFANDNADVIRFKSGYNAAIDQLTQSARVIAQAAAENTADAQAAATMIQTVIDNDGLNNPSGFLHWLESTADDIGGYLSAHWVGFVKLIANVAGILATVCGILAMIFAFIPGLQAFAALFETLALLAQFVAFACHVALLATGHGSLFDVIVDAIGLVTFGVGKGLIGSAEATADIAEESSSAYEAVARAGDDSIGTWREAGDAAIETASKASDTRLVSQMIDQVKEVISIRPVFKNALEAWKAGEFGDAMGENAASTLWGGFKSAMGMSSPDIASAVDKSVAAGTQMPGASGIAWGLTSRIEIAQNEFRMVQITGLGTDLTSKLDSILNFWSPAWPEKAG
jgi:hypothetical protein